MTEQTPAERPADDDYDLLTYGEAGARLADEIRKEQAHLQALIQGSQDSETGHAQIAATQQRIKDLIQAADRHEDHQEQARDFVRFFGYDPRARS